MFERFTESARRSLFFARFEASQLGGTSIETEHMLLGLVREGSVQTLLPSVPLERLRRALEGAAHSKEKLSTSVEIPFSRATQLALNLAVEEAELLLHAHIGSEHLLLGLLRDEQSAAAAALAEHGVRLSDVRRRVKELSGTPKIPSESGARPAIDRIKALVDQLAHAPRDSAEAGALVSRIHASLDELLNGHGLR